MPTTTKQPDFETLAHIYGSQDDVTEDRCYDCSEALPEGGGVEFKGRVRCRDCNFDERAEALRKAASADLDRLRDEKWVVQL